MTNKEPFSSTSFGSFFIAPVIIIGSIGIILFCTFFFKRYEASPEKTEVEVQNSPVNIRKVEFDGHLWVVFDRTWGGGIAHHPDCPCRKKDKKD